MIPTHTLSTHVAQNVSNVPSSRPFSDDLFYKSLKFTEIHKDLQNLWKLSELTLLGTLSTLIHVQCFNG